MVLSRARLVLASSVLMLPAAAQTVVVSSALQLSGDLAPGAASEIQQTPALSFGAGQYLQVWNDSRSKQTNEWGEYGGEDILAQRLDASGAVLDAAPFAISNLGGWQRYPRVAWNGAHWLVVWTSQTPTQFFYEDHVWAARVAPDGTVDAAPLDLGVGEGQFVSVCANGPEWLVVFPKAFGTGEPCYGFRVAASGVALNPGGTVLIPGTEFISNPRVASAGGDYLLINNPSGFTRRRFTATLAPVGGVGSIPGAQVSSNGSSYFLTWTNPGELRGSPLSLNGAPTITGGAVLASGQSIADFTAAQWDGVQWRATWIDDSTGVRTARVNAAGAVLDAGGVAFEASYALNARQLSSAAGAGEAHAAWADSRLEVYDVFGAHCDALGVVGAVAPEVTSPPTQLFSSVKPGPNGQWLAATQARASGVSRALVWRLDAAGAALDSEPIELASGASISAPAVAFDGQRYLIAWSDNSQVFARRMLPDGTFVDAAPFVVMDGGVSDVAALGSTFLVVGSDFTPTIQFRYIFGARVDGGTGTVLDASRILLSTSYATGASVSQLGGRWLAVWQRNFSLSNPQSQVEAIFIDASGVLSSTLVVAAAAGKPALAVSDDRAFIAYRTGSSSGAQNDLAARFLDPSGAFLGASFSVSTAVGKQLFPGAAFDGVHFWATWEDQRNQTSFFDQRTDLYGARVSSVGAVLDPNAFTIATGASSETKPTMAARDGLVLLASSEIPSDLGVYRLTTRLLFDGCPTPQAYCSSTANSTGQASAIGFVGGAGLAANDLTLTAGNLPGAGTGTFFVSTLARDPGVSSGNGVLCVRPPLRRLGVVSISAGATQQAIDWTSPAFAGFAAGDTLFFQLWHRDPAAGGSNTNFSNALAVTLCP